MSLSKLNNLNYPIETKEAQKFWASRHKCNKMKSIIAFSLNLDNANDNLRRYGYSRAWRKRALVNFGRYINNPKMVGVNFSELADPWWVCMPYTGSSDIPVLDYQFVMSRVGLESGTDSYGYKKNNGVPVGSVDMDSTTTMFDVFLGTLDTASSVPSPALHFQASPGNALIGRVVKFTTPNGYSYTSTKPLDGHEQHISITNKSFVEELITAHTENKEVVIDVGVMDDIPTVSEGELVINSMGEMAGIDKWVGYKKGSLGSIDEDSTTAGFSEFLVLVDSSNMGHVKYKATSDNPLLGQTVLFSTPSGEEFMSNGPLVADSEVSFQLTNNSFAVDMKEAHESGTLPFVITVTVFNKVLKDWIDAEFWDDKNDWGY